MFCNTGVHAEMCDKKAPVNVLNVESFFRKIFGNCILYVFYFANF